MKRRLSVLSAAFALLIGSCAPRLDLNPALDIPNAQSIKNVDDLNQVLMSAYASLGSKHFLGGSIKVWGDLLSDQVLINTASPYALKETNLVRRNINANDSLVILAWENGYKAVNLSNHIIDKIESNSLSGQSYNLNRNRMLGEALFIRATALFELVRYFGPAYNSANASLPAIPMPLKPATVREAAATASLDEVYNQIRADLTRAAGLLPFSYPNSTAKSGQFNVYGNATAAAAKAMLARVAFQQGGAANESLALQSINEVIGQVDTIKTGVYYPQNFPVAGSSTSDFTNDAYLLYGAVGRGAFSVNTINQTEYPEAIFSILNRGDQDISPEVFYRYVYDSRIPGANPRYLVADSFLIENFSPPTIDLRNLLYIRGVFRYNNRYCFQKLLNSSTQFNIIVLRSAELLLTRARIHYNIALTQSNPAERSKYLRYALHDLFYLKKRARRFTTGSGRPLDNPTLSYNNANQPNNTSFEADLDRELNRERARELFNEGDRLHDFRRRQFTVIPGNKEPGADNIPNWSLPLDKSILPIPVSETSVSR